MVTENGQITVSLRGLDRSKETAGGDSNTLFRLECSYNGYWISGVTGMDKRR